MSKSLSDGRNSKVTQCLLGHHYRKAGDVRRFRRPSADNHDMLQSITRILVFQIAGEFIARFWNLSVPGPVIGMVLLLAAFFLKDDLLDGVRSTAGFLLANLSLLFVPAGVGIMRHGERFMNEGFGIIATLVLSTLIAMLVTAWTILWVERLMHLSEED